MLVASWKNGRLEVVALKAAPGWAVVEEAGGGRQALEMAALGVGAMGLPEKPLAVWWLEKAKLPPGEHRTPPKGYPKKESDYAGPGYTFPVSTERKVRSALAYFEKHPWESASEKRAAARKILRAAHKFGIEVGKEDSVYKEAHGG